MNKWLYSFALVDPLSLNLHLRFYTMVDRKFEQHLVLYDKLFIYLYKWLLPFDWMMNELNLSNITYMYIYDIQYATLMPKGNYCLGGGCWIKHRIICVWMNEWMELCLCFCIYIYNYIFFLHKMEKKIKNEKTTFTKCYRFVYLACCVSVQLAPMTDKHFLYLCINTLSWTQMSDYK